MNHDFGNDPNTDSSFIRLKKTAVCVALAVTMQACQSCPPVTIKTLDINPTVATGTAGFAGSKGWCTSVGNIPPVPFSPGSGQVMVGFDDYFKAGTNPFPCDDIRAVNFRGGVRFDLSPFDSIVTADLLFEAVRSIKRITETTSTSPPESFANVLCVATQPFTSQMLCDNDATLPATHVINIGVSSQVRDWIDKSRPNNGFVIAGPRGPVSSSNPPEDNEARITFYGNIKLRVHYNPKQNPRAPQ